MGKSKAEAWSREELKDYLGVLKFTDMYNWGIKEIYEFMKDILKGEKYKEVLDLDKKKPILEDLYKQIRRLSERLPTGDSGAEAGDGDDFRSPEADLAPDQHIRRTFVMNDPDVTKKETRFDVVVSEVLKQPYWNPWDLLGSFLSVVGSAPATANKGNFFVPLMAVYARWTTKIAEHEKPAGATAESGDWSIFTPGMYQVTWAWHKDRKSPPFWLGSNFSGCRADAEARSGWWEFTIKERRFNMLPLHSKLKKEVNNFNMNADGVDLSNDKPFEKRSGNRYGCCAEQYVFLHMSDDHGLHEQYDFIPPPQSVYFGAAFARDFFSKKPEGLTAYNAENMSKTFRKPCSNCANLLKLLEWPPDNFNSNKLLGDRPLTDAQSLPITSKKSVNTKAKGETTLWEKEVTL